MKRSSYTRIYRNRELAVAEMIDRHNRGWSITEDDIKRIGKKHNAAKHVLREALQIINR